MIRTQNIRYFRKLLIIFNPTNIKTGQARVRLAPQGFRTIIGDLELFLKFRLSLARAVSSYASKLCPPFKVIIFRILQTYSFQIFS